LILVVLSYGNFSKQTLPVTKQLTVPAFGGGERSAPALGLVPKRGLVLMQVKNGKLVKLLPRTKCHINCKDKMHPRWGAYSTPQAL